MGSLLWASLNVSKLIYTEDVNKSIAVVTFSCPNFLVSVTSSHVHVPFFAKNRSKQKKTKHWPGYSFYQFNLNIYIVSILIHRWDFKEKRVLWHFYFLSHLLIHVHFASIPGVRLYIICIYIVGEN